MSRCPFELIITSDNSNDNCSAAVWDPSTGSLMHQYKHAGLLGYHSLQLLKDSYLLASSATKQNLIIWPLNSQMPMQNFRLGTPGLVTALACAPSGSFIAAAIKRSDTNKIYIWQTCNGQLLRTISRHYQSITCLIFNIDGSCLASGAEDGLIFVWDFSQVINEEEAKPLSTFSHTLPVKDLHFGKIGPSGRLYSVSLDKSCRIYNVHTQETLLNLIFDVPLTVISTDIMENNIFVGSSNGKVFKCSLRTPPRGIDYHLTMNDKNEIISYKGHTDKITALSVSIDCKTLLTGSADEMVYLWDIESCQILLTIKHKAPIISAFFATAYKNFTVQNLEPSLKIKAFQTVPQQGGLNKIKKCRKTYDNSWLLDFEKEGKSNAISMNEDELADCKAKLDNALAEVEQLKKINAELYRYHAKNIIK